MNTILDRAQRSTVPRGIRSHKALWLRWIEQRFPKSKNPMRPPVGTSREPSGRSRPLSQPIQRRVLMSQNPTFGLPGFTSTHRALYGQIKGIHKHWPSYQQ